MAVPRPLTREQASEELRGIYDKLTQKFGRMPNIFATMANSPLGLKSFMPFFSAILHEGEVEAKYKELAYLKVSTVNGCEYCVSAHTPIAVDAGVTPKQIRALSFYKDADVFDEKERATIRFADVLTRGAVASSEDLLEKLAAHYTPSQIVELALVIGAANVTNMFSTGLLIEPDMGEVS